MVKGLPLSFFFGTVRRGTGKKGILLRGRGKDTGKKRIPLRGTG